MRQEPEYNRAGFIKPASQVAYNPRFQRYSNKPKPIQKITQKNERRDYYYKEHVASNASPQKRVSMIPEIEAVGAQLIRLVFGPDFSPKLRVIENTGASISKTIPAYKPAQTLSSHELQQLTERDVAKIILKMFCFRDPDLHMENWGRNGNCMFLAPDQDRLFGDFSNSRQQNECYMDPSIMSAVDIMKWSNLIYSAKDAFSVISADDIDHFPEYHDVRPYNHPFTPGLSEAVDNRLRELKLKKNPLFHLWKFFYLTKFLFLLTEERVTNIIQDHTRNDPTFRKELFDDIMQHRRKIKAVLFAMPTYQIFLKEVLQTYFSEMHHEIIAYQKEFQDKAGLFKVHKAHHRVFENRTNFNGAIKKFIEEAQAFDAAYSDHSKKKDEINLLMSRLERDFNALNGMSTIFDNEQKRVKKINLMKKKSDHTLTGYFLRTIRQELEGCEVGVNQISEYTKNCSSPHFHDFIDHLIRTSQFYVDKCNTIQDGLKKQIGKYIIEALSLLCQHIDFFSSEKLNQLAKAWAILMPDAFPSIIFFFFNHVPFEKIPEILCVKLFDEISYEIICENFSDRDESSQAFFKVICKIKKIREDLVMGSCASRIQNGIFRKYGEKNIELVIDKLQALFTDANHRLTLSRREFILLSSVIKENYFNELYLEAPETECEEGYRIHLDCNHFQWKMTAEPATNAKCANPTEYKDPCQLR